MLPKFTNLGKYRIQSVPSYKHVIVVKQWDFLSLAQAITLSHITICFPITR